MNKTITIKIDNNLNERKIKYILSGTLGLSKGIITKLKKINGIFLNGECVHVDKIVKCGEELVITIPEEASENIIGENIPLDILYEDEDVIVLNKPFAMPTHPSKNHYTGTLANAVMYYFNNNFSFRVITRLDKDTSGVVLIAKNHLAAQRMNDEMRNGNILKEYVAVVNGVPVPDKGVITAPIKRAENKGMCRIVALDGKTAITHYTLEKTVGNLSLVRLIPVTGRTHQLRVHMSYIGNPIYGDDMYGATQRNERTRLHCEKLIFYHPTSGEKIAVSASIPHDIEALIQQENY